MDLPKHRYEIHLKFGEKFLTSLTKLELEANASIYFAIKKSTFILLWVFGICCRFHNLTYFNNKVCITKKHFLKKKPLTVQLSH